MRHTRHASDRIARRHPGRPSRARFGVIAEGTEGIRNGDSVSVSAACDAYFLRNHMSPEPFVFGKADFRRSA